MTTHGMPQLNPELGGQEMFQAWDELLEQEREAFEEAQDQRQRMLNRMKERLDRFQKTPGVGDEEYDRKQEDAIEELLDEARNALPKRKAHPEEEGEEDDGNEAGAEDEDEVASQQEMSMQVDEIVVEDRPANLGHIDLTGVDAAKVPSKVVGTVIDIADPPLDTRPVSEGPSQHADLSLPTLSSRTTAPLLPTIPEEPQSHPPSRITDHGPTESLPTDVAEPRHDVAAPRDQRKTDGRERTPTPAVNQIAATPQTSQDAPAGTVTNLVVPQGTQNVPNPRSGSRSPIPSESPMLTRTKSRSCTPAAPALPHLPPAHIIGTRATNKSQMNVDSGQVPRPKRKATHDEDGPHKRKKEA